MRHVLFMEPVDVWSFRDGRPFEAGEAFDATSLFPPAPWTTLGCIRTALLRRHCGDPERYAGRPRSSACPVCGHGPCHALPVVGEAGGSAPFAVGPPLPATWRKDHLVEVRYPTPADLVELAADDGGCPTPRLLIPQDVPPTAGHSLCGLAPLAVPVHGRIRPYRSRWVSRQQLASVLDGKPPGPPEDEHTLVFSEPRIGIGMDYGRNTAAEGQLYMREVVRLEEGAGLAVHIEKPLGLDAEIARLGGDGRMVRMRETEAQPHPGMPSDIGRRLKVYLASATWLSGGHTPGFIVGQEGVWPGTDVSVQLVACALSPASAVGGWDLKRQAPRPMKRLVGAGSVYFFEVLRGEPAAVAARVHGQAFCDDENMARSGFGLAFAGRW